MVCDVAPAQGSSAAHWAPLWQLPGQGRTLLRLQGQDVERFLQGILTCDIGDLEPDGAVPGAILTVKGKLVSEVIVLPRDSSEQGIDLLVPTDVVDGIQANLDRHIIMDDVTVERDETARTALVWPAEAAPKPGSELRAFAAVHPGPGTLIVGTESALEAALGGLTRADEAAFTRHRIEAGAPAWGHEVVADRFPPEVGYAGAVSYTKGCYMGQEPLARIHARGQVNWVLVRVKSDAAVPPATALSAEGRDDAGRVTSAASDGSGMVGLAVVHRSAAAPGTGLKSGAGDVEVVSGPLGDDPGVKG